MHSLVQRTPASDRRLGTVLRTMIVERSSGEEIASRGEGARTGSLNGDGQGPQEVSKLSTGVISYEFRKNRVHLQYAF